ncbi:MAG: carboxyl transferase [Lachnospiraceae bacterium]|nr:carboxyl transferase [Lachnospiraceae bacterium]
MSNSSLAGKRIESLLDENSFVEIGAGISARATDFNMEPKDAVADGVVTGYGLIDGRLVYVYSQDPSVLGGSVGEMHAKKIVSLYDLALKVGAPVIGIIDSAGLRLNESFDALDAFGSIYRAQAMASGVIPQITAIFGKCGGGLSVFTGMTDFTFMEGDSARLFVNSPNALSGNYEEKLDTAKAAFQADEAGNVDIVASEAEIYDEIRSFISLLPSNNDEFGASSECTDDLNRAVADIVNCKGDTAIALSMIADDNSYYEVKAGYGKEMTTGFIRLNGQTVGCVANRSEIYDDESKKVWEGNGTLTPNAVSKAADFVNFCDSFDIPLLTLTNVTGYEADTCCEKKIAKAAGKLAYAFANATVAKVNVVIGKAFGTAGILMNSKSLGCDLTLAWSDAKIGMMDSKLAASIIYDGKGADAVSAGAGEYDKLQNNIGSAARRGYVDQIIEAADTRKYLIGAFEMLYTKREDRPAKKHGAV